MKVIAVQNQKGGTGKTTVGTNVAACLTLRGERVLLIDADHTQESAMVWASINEGEYFDVIGKQANSIRAYIERNENNYDYVIIDCPPRANADAGKFIAVSHLVLIPIQPSPYDIWASNDLVEIIKARQQATAGIPDFPENGLPHAHFLLSRATKKSLIIDETLAALEDTGFSALTAMTTNYDVYKRAPITGHTVFDAPNITNKIAQREAQQQIQDITSEIIEILTVKERDNLIVA